MANMECLRNMAMLMVVLLHYLSKGDFLAPLTERMAPNNYVAWFLEAFAIVAVNVYVLISGYFMVDSEFQLKKLGKLLAEVLFYSILIPVVMLLLATCFPTVRDFFEKSGVTLLSFHDLNLYRLIQYFIPLQMEHYWFVTAYVIMYLLSPFLVMGAKVLKKKKFEELLICLLVFFSLAKTILPVKLQMDDLGYGALWFITVFLVAVYIRMYGIPFFKNWQISLLCYLGSVLLIFFTTMAIRYVYFATGKLGNFVQSPYSYNHAFTLFGAVSLFYCFYYLKLSDTENFGKLCVLFGPHTLGVYLLHEHVEVRWVWPKWFGASINVSTWMLILKCFLTILVVYGIGIAVDIFRGIVFKKLSVKKGTTVIYHDQGRRR